MYMETDIKRVSCYRSLFVQYEQLTSDVMKDRTTSLTPFYSPSFLFFSFHFVSFPNPLIPWASHQLHPRPANHQLHTAAALSSPTSATPRDTTLKSTQSPPLFQGRCWELLPRSSYRARSILQEADTSCLFPGGVPQTGYVRPRRYRSRPLLSIPGGMTHVSF